MFLINRVPKAPFIVLIGWVAYSVVVRAPSSASAQPKDSAAADLQPVETDMHEYMEYVNQPTYKKLQDAMKQAPDGEGGWLAIKSGALILAESGNLIMLRGPDGDRGEWNSHAIAVRKAGAQLYKAAHEKNFQQATTDYRSMLDECNACHQQFAKGEHQLAP